MNPWQLPTVGLAGVAALCAALHVSSTPALAQGYTDTPLIPGTNWHVHDSERPRPAVVDPGPYAGPVAPPSDAVVLFDGTDTSAWIGDKGVAMPWQVTDGMMQCIKRVGGIRTKEAFGDVQLHIEWAAPTDDNDTGQGRGNSGVFFGGGRYELQVLDSYQNTTYADGQAAALYAQQPPMVNVTRPPGQWNVYDIIYRAPRFEGDKLVSPAVFTVWHNGVLVQDHVALHGPSTHKKVSGYKPHPVEMPISLQNHGDAVSFRNIWLRKLPPKQ